MVAVIPHKYFDHIDGRIFFHLGRLGPTYEITRDEELALNKMLKQHSKTLKIGFGIILAANLVLLPTGYLFRDTTVVPILALLGLSGFNLFGVIYILMKHLGSNQNLKKFFLGKSPCDFNETMGESLTSARLRNEPDIKLLALMVFGIFCIIFGFYVGIGANGLQADILSQIKAWTIFGLGIALTSAGLYGYYKKK